MEIPELIESARCCDLKECDVCPSRARTACRERVMQELAQQVENLLRGDDPAGDIPRC